MARDISSGFQTEIEGDNLSIALLIKAEFDGGDVLTWSGYGDIVYDGDTYQGTGLFLSMSEIEETQKMQANGVTYSLSGIPSELVAIALSEEYQGRPITAWFAVLDSDRAIIADPYKIFSGKMDVMDTEDDGESAVITIRAESDLSDMRDAKERRYTPEDQKLDYEDDLGLDFTPTIQDIEVVWG